MARHLTTILVNSSQAFVAPLCFLIDSGSELNVVKASVLNSKVSVKQDIIKSFTGICTGRICRCRYGMEILFKFCGIYLFWFLFLWGDIKQLVFGRIC